MSKSIVKKSTKKIISENNEKIKAFTENCFHSGDI